MTDTLLTEISQTETQKTDTYHHGDLKEALLNAADVILERDGVKGLTLRAAAREAGVSHAAPKNHFGNLSGLLSALAARGFRRFARKIDSVIDKASGPEEESAAAGRGYVEFALENPAMFHLMFRSENLDYTQLQLSQASDAALRGLAMVNGVRMKDGTVPELTLTEAARMAQNWSLAHGISMLLLDGQLSPILDRLPQSVSRERLIEAILTRQEASAS